MILSFSEWVLHQPGDTPTLYKELLKATGLDAIHDTPSRMVAFITRCRRKPISQRQLRKDIHSLFADFTVVTARPNNCTEDLMLFLSGTEALSVKQIYPNLSHREGTVRKNLSALTKRGHVKRIQRYRQPSLWELTEAGRQHCRDYLVTGVKPTWSRRRKWMTKT